LAWPETQKGLSVKWGNADGSGWAEEREESKSNRPILKMTFIFNIVPHRGPLRL
jgi:hypothetical protein